MSSTEISGTMDSANVVALPPLIYFAALVAGGVLQWLIGGNIVDTGLVLGITGFVLLAAGLGLELWFAAEFKRIGQDVKPTTPTPSITADGPFRFSRNPAYVGLTAIQVGLAFMCNSPWLLVTLVPTLIVMHYGVILREEAYLERTFGDEYRRYRIAVRRYL